MLWLSSLIALALGGIAGWLLAAARLRAALNLAVRDADLRAAAATAEAAAIRAELEARKQEAEQVRTRLREAEATAWRVTASA